MITALIYHLRTLHNSTRIIVLYIAVELSMAPKITEILVADNVILDSWSRIFYNFVNTSLRQKKIENLLRRDDFHLAILTSIRAWISEAGEHATFDNLVNIFTTLQYNGVAG